MPAPLQESPAKVALIFAVSTLSFAVMTAFGKSLAVYSTIQIVFFRNFIALLTVLTFMQCTKRTQLLKTTRIKEHMWRGIFGLSSMFCYFASFKYIPLAEATAIWHAQPILLTLLSIMLLGERPKANRWIGTCIGLIGVMIMLNPSGIVNYSGTLLAVGAAIFSAAAMIMVSRLGHTESSDTIVFFFMLWGTLISGVLLPFNWITPSSNDLLCLLATGVFGAIGQLLMVVGYRRAEASLIAGLNYMQIVWSAIIGYIIWSELPRLTVIIGVLVVFISQFLLIKFEKNKSVAVGVQPLN